MEQQIKPGSGIKNLAFLIGTWRTEGELIGGPNEPTTINGTDMYEWTAGGSFILHKVDVLMGEEKTEVTEIIGHDPESHTYPMHSYDNRGNYTVMTGRLEEDGMFTIEGEGARSVLTKSEDSNYMSASWEWLEVDNGWIPWLEMKFSKHSSEPGYA